MLTKDYKKKRLEWAKKNESWSEVDWENVLFTDKTRIEIRPNIGQGTVWKRVGETLHEYYIVNTVKFSDGNVVMWSELVILIWRNLLC